MKKTSLKTILKTSLKHFTATPFCMIPCFKLNNHDLNFRPEKGVFNKLLNLWSAEVGVDIEKQIISGIKKKTI